MRRAARLVEPPALGHLIAVRGQVIMAVDEAGQERETCGVDHLPGRPAHARSACRHRLDPPAFDGHDRVAYRWCPGAVDQRPDSDDGHRAISPLLVLARSARSSSTIW